MRVLSLATSVAITMSLAPKVEAAPAEPDPAATGAEEQLSPAWSEFREQPVELLLRDGSTANGTLLAADLRQVVLAAKSGRVFVVATAEVVQLRVRAGKAPAPLAVPVGEVALPDLAWRTLLDQPIRMQPEPAGAPEGGWILVGFSDAYVTVARDLGTSQESEIQFPRARVEEVFAMRWTFVDPPPVVQVARPPVTEDTGVPRPGAPQRGKKFAAVGVALIFVGVPLFTIGSIELWDLNTADQGGGIYDRPGPCHDVHPCEKNIGPGLAIGVGLAFVVTSVVLLVHAAKLEGKYHAWNKRHARLAPSSRAQAPAGMLFSF